MSSQGVRAGLNVIPRNQTEQASGGAVALQRGLGQYFRLKRKAAKTTIPKNSEKWILIEKAPEDNPYKLGLKQKHQQYLIRNMLRFYYGGRRLRDNRPPERRLDTLVWRSLPFSSLMQARQQVRHHGGIMRLPFHSSQHQWPGTIMKAGAARNFDIPMKSHHPKIFQLTQIPDDVEVRFGGDRDRKDSEDFGPVEGDGHDDEGKAGNEEEDRARADSQQKRADTIEVDSAFFQRIFPTPLVQSSVVPAHTALLGLTAFNDVNDLVGRMVDLSQSGPLYRPQHPMKEIEAVDMTLASHKDPTALKWRKDMDRMKGYKLTTEETGKHFMMRRERSSTRKKAHQARKLH
eukprot:Clim_evm3s49 gene=Clim_evmTU3s49